jgi:EAL domain-containing protein (putative c-di-GMP-specific phosphodiesterase class I)/GGDEF domain-containing protein
MPYSLMDQITYLPNRTHFIESYADGSLHGDTIIMVTLADAAHYNQILRALGHDYAENFIRAGAARVRALIDADVPLHHTSILSFAAILEGNQEDLAARVIADMKAPMECGGVPIATRVGVGLAKRKGMHGADLLRNALVAAQNSRISGSGWAYYDAKPDAEHRRGFLLVSQLADALRARDQLSLNFQPKYDLATRRATGAEALIRWKHPQLGLISPAEFIPMIEATALIDQLTDWVLEQSIAQLAQWHAQGFAYTMAVNISPQNLMDVDVVEKLAAVIARHGIDPHFLELEFSEGGLVGQNAGANARLRAIRDLGVHVALDDFGTGFFNLRYINGVPADIIKIDRAFIRDIEKHQQSAIVVHALVDIAHRLGFRVVADGIETFETYRMLADWGCDQGQGFFLSKPLDQSEFASWMLLNQPPQAQVAA